LGIAGIDGHLLSDRFLPLFDGGLLVFAVLYDDTLLLE